MNPLPPECTPTAWLFDFDGVLADSLPVHKAAWREACTIMFGKVPPPDPNERLDGLSIQDIATSWARRAGHPERRDELMALKDRIATRNAGQIAALPGVRELLQALQEKHIPWAIASNTTLGFIQAVLTGWQLHCPAIATADTVARPKPHPDPWHTCIAMLGLQDRPTASMVGFDDQVPGIAGLQHAGITAVGIAQPGSRHAVQLQQHHCAAIIPGLLAVQTLALPRLALD